jgi:hypothetical protein
MTGGCREQGPISRPELRPRDLAAEKLELMAQHKQLDVLYMQAAAVTDKRTKQGPESELEKGENHVLDPPSPCAKKSRHQYWRPSGWRRCVLGYRYRVGGRGSRRVQRGGFQSERDAGEALERALERLRRANGTASTLTLATLVKEYLAQHDAQPETIEKLRWLLAKGLATGRTCQVGRSNSRAACCSSVVVWRSERLASRSSP